MYEILGGNNAAYGAGTGPSLAPPGGRADDRADPVHGRLEDRHPWRRADPRRRESRCAHAAGRFADSPPRRSAPRWTLRHRAVIHRKRTAENAGERLRGLDEGFGQAVDGTARFVETLRGGLPEGGQEKTQN